MSFTVAQIDAQTKIFEQAYRKGEITQGQYQHAMRVQSTNRAAALKREQSQPKQQPSAPAQTPTAAGLPRSNYWGAMPSPAKPSVIPASGADLTRAGGTQITPPEGYVVTNVQPTMVEMEGPIAPGKTKADMMVPAVSYELTPKPEPVKQSDLSIASQLNIAYQTSLKVFYGLIDKNTVDNPVANRILKAEIDYGVAPILGAHAGSIATLEGAVYGTAGLAGSIYKSAKDQKLVYASGFEGFNEQWKTPRLSPTSVGSVVGLVTGNPQEAQEINRMPSTYGWGYGMGSALAEVGIAAIESKGIGKLTSFIKGVKVYKLGQVKELERITGTGTTLTSTKLTNPVITSQRVPVRVAKQLDDLSRYVTPKKILLGGTEIKAERYVDDTFRIMKQGVNVSRDAGVYTDTIKSMIKTQPNLIDKIKSQVGRLTQKFGGTKAPSLVSTTEAGAITTDGRTFASKTLGFTHKGKGIIYQTDSLASKDMLYPMGQAYSTKTFTTHLIEGTMDPSKYLDFVKNVGPDVAQGWYKQMGGVPMSVLEQSVSKGGMKGGVILVTDVVGVSFKGANMGLIGLGVGTARLAGYGTAAQKKIDHTGKTQSFTITGTPKENQIISTPKVDFSGQTTEKKQPTDLGYRYSYTPSIDQKEKPITAPFSGWGTTPARLPDTDTTVDIFPDTAKKDDVITTPFTSIREDQAITPIFKPVSIPIDLTPTPTPFTYKTPRFPMFPVGGGGGGRGSSDGLTGKWFKYKNPVKTPKQMLKDFSTFGSTKRTKKQSFGTFGFKTGMLKSNPILGFNSSKGNKRQKTPFGNFNVNTRSNPILNFQTFGGGKSRGKQTFGLSIPKTNLVSINANMFKQPRKRYNKVKQRRKSKR